MRKCLKKRLQLIGSKLISVSTVLAMLIASVPFISVPVSANTLEAPFRIKLSYSDDGQTWTTITRDFGNLKLTNEKAWWRIDEIQYDGNMNHPIYITGNIAFYGLKIVGQSETRYLSFARSGGNLGTSNITRPWGGAFYNEVGKFNYNTYGLLMDPIPDPEYDNIVYLQSPVYYCSFQLRADNGSSSTLKLTNPVILHFRFGTSSDWTPVQLCISANTFVTLGLNDVLEDTSVISSHLNNIWRYIEYWDQFIMKIGDLSTATQTQISLLTQILAKQGEIKSDTGSIRDRVIHIDGSIDELLEIEQGHEQMIQDALDIGAGDAMDQAYQQAEDQDAFGQVEAMGSAVDNLPSFNDGQLGSQTGLDSALSWFSTLNRSYLHNPDLDTRDIHDPVPDFITENLEEIYEALGGVPDG